MDVTYDMNTKSSTEKLIGNPPVPRVFISAFIQHLCRSCAGSIIPKAVLPIEINASIMFQSSCAGKVAKQQHSDS